MNPYVLLAYYPKLTFRRYQDMRAVFPSLADAWRANENDYRATGWDENFIREFISWKNNVREDRIGQTLERENIHCIPCDDPAYPHLLKEIYDPPFCLFVRGSIDNLANPFAVVGPRVFSLYGKQVTEEIIPELARSDVTIVSGLALGIDGIAHHAALRAEGRTIAVLGSGNDRNHVQPAGHRYLAEDIIEHGGAVITEYPPGTDANKYTFPRRNRIVAGMSVGTLVIEAGATSGSLITAQCALDQGREVFAVPQNITSPTAEGVNNLIKMGAKPVTSAADILESLDLRKQPQNDIHTDVVPDSPIEAVILKYLGREPIHADELIKQCAADSGTVLGALTLLEMKGVIRHLGGHMYTIAR